MDPRIQVKDSPRPGTSRQLAETPLVSIAWRLLQPQLQQLAEERQQAAADIRAVVKALAEMVKTIYKTQKRIPTQKDGGTTTTESAPGRRDGSMLLKEAQAELSRCHITVVVDEGMPYSGHLMEIIHNVAQLPVSGLTGPVIHEIIAPAILYKGELVMAGKAVIAVPPPKPCEGTAGEDQPDATR